MPLQPRWCAEQLCEALLNLGRDRAVNPPVTPREGASGADHATNMWEELNRPRAVHQHVPPPPTAADAIRRSPTGDGAPDVAAQFKEASDQVREALAKLDSEHVLLAATGVFIVVAAFLLGGLGGSGSGEIAGEAPPVPEALAVIDPPINFDALVAPEPVPEPAVVPPPLPTAPPAAMAMGLPAELLDSSQSKVFRLYRTALGREPDRDGFAFWSDQVRSGVPLERLAQEFLASEEYVTQFGSDTGWDTRAEQLLTNAFGPASSPAEMDARRERFRGLDGEALLVAISEADETLDATGTLR